MKRILVPVMALCAIVLLATAGNAQEKDQRSKSTDRERSAIGTVARGTGKAAVIIVGSAAEATWVTTKFTGKHLVKPVAKAVLLKAAPKIMLFTLKQSAASVKRLTPVLLKLAVL